jgi:hypothetical protein
VRFWLVITERPSVGRRLIKNIKICRIDAQNGQKGNPKE